MGNTPTEWEQAGPVTIEPVTKYYTFGGQKVAMRQGEQVYYLHGDHLGSTSLTTDHTGALVSEVRYHPYGQERWSNGATPTDFGFTSQRNEASFGLMDYNARYYSPVLGRFVSPDSIVPEPTSSGGFNRYRYARNSPLMYTDPTGHFALTTILTGAAIGAVAGGSVNYGWQVYDNVTNNDMTLADAMSFENIDGGAVVQATVQGGITGATLAIPGAASITTGVLGMAGLGAVGNTVGGQAGALAHGAWDAASNALSTEGAFNGSDMMDTAYQAGFANPMKAGVDAMVGGVTAGVTTRIFSGPTPPQPLHTSGQLPTVKLPITHYGQTVVPGGVTKTGTPPLSLSPKLLTQQNIAISLGGEVVKRVTGPASRGLSTPPVKDAIERVTEEEIP